MSHTECRFQLLLQHIQATTFQVVFQVSIHHKWDTLQLISCKVLTRSRERQQQQLILSLEHNNSYYGQQMYGASQMMAPGLPSAQMQQQPGMSSNPAYVQTLAWVPVGQGQSVMSTATGNIAAHEPMALSYQGTSAYPTVPMPPPTSAQARGLTRDFDMELRAAQQQRDLLYRGDLLPEDSAYLLSDRPTRPRQRPINSLPQLEEMISINPVTQSAR